VTLRGSLPEKLPLFDGDDYVPARDDARLGGQMRRIYDRMKRGEWLTLGQIGRDTESPEASVSAQLRHLRKPRFGGHEVQRRHVGRGLYEYRLLVQVPLPLEPPR
jgi:hypothetical protein